MLCVLAVPKKTTLKDICIDIQISLWGVLDLCTVSGAELDYKGCREVHRTATPPTAIWESSCQSKRMPHFLVVLFSFLSTLANQEISVLNQTLGISFDVSDELDLVWLSREIASPTDNSSNLGLSEGIMGLFSAFGSLSCSFVAMVTFHIPPNYPVFSDWRPYLFTSMRRMQNKEPLTCEGVTSITKTFVFSVVAPDVNVS